MQSDRERILQVIRENIVKVLPGVSPDLISPDRQLRDIGANSLDRMDIVVGAMEDLGIKIPFTEFGAAKDIDTLAGVLHAGVRARR